MMSLLAMVLLLLLLMLLPHLLLVSNLPTAAAVPHPHPLSRRLSIVVIPRAGAGTGLGLAGPLPGLVLLLLVVLGQELSLRIGDGEVAEHVRGGEGFLFKVIISHGLLTGVPLGGVHDQQLLEQLECLGLW